MTTPPPPPQTYESMCSRFDTIVSVLEKSSKHTTTNDGALTLDEILAYVREGNMLQQHLGAKLREAKEKVNIALTGSTLTEDAMLD